MSFRNKLRRLWHGAILDGPFRLIASSGYIKASSCVWMLYFEHWYNQHSDEDEPCYLDIEVYDANGAPLMVVHYGGETSVMPVVYELSGIQRPKFPLKIKRT